MSDTPIYDQIRRELRAGAAPASQPSRASTAPSSQDGGRRSVSVWTLVEEHRRRS